MPTPSQLRDQLQQKVILELLGPAGGPEEIVTEPTVRGRYLVGKLGPKGQSPLPELDDLLDAGEDEGELDVAGVDDEDGVTEARPPHAASMQPSSMGLSFVVDADAKALQVTARWGRYRRVVIEDEQYRHKNREGHRPVWQRQPVEGATVLSLQPGLSQPWAPDPDQPEVYVQALMRRRDAHWHVSLFLVNGQQEPKVRKDEAWVFQPELVVEAPDAAAIFLSRQDPDAFPEPDLRAMAMRYRHRLEFAVGHGVAVEADQAPGQPHRAVRLRTVVLPIKEIPVTLPRRVEGLTLDMKTLGDIPNGQFVQHLTPLVRAYQQWIDAQEARIATEPDLAPFTNEARQALNDARVALERIRASIALLDANPDAAEAFRFANRAMHLQRVHSLYAAQVRQGKNPNYAEVDVPENHTWRTFQLAFLLLNLPALTDPTHPERTGEPLAGGGDQGQAIADLLWFPTGGGKTEAYLGVAAYAMAIRRLQGEVGGRSGHAGVTVLMRYTLRLLTLQQFQRAAALIAACEHLRRQRPALWGDEPFRLGLWVGRHSTPNWTKDAAEAIKQTRSQSGRVAGGTPYQLTNCPWCGAPIDPGRDIEVDPPDQGRGRTILYCGDPTGRCEFTKRRNPEEGIPVVVVDEEVYRRLPTMIIATVDKFAQMPWNGRTAMLFGQVDGYCERHGFRSPDIQDEDSHRAKPRKGLPAARTIPMQPLRPPDLIIQDELHLISGPLGTLVGLYETAVDALASWEVDGVRVHPKIIASTATVRRAHAQVFNVFLRHVKIFPPPGLDADDNFFSYEDQPTPERPGRRYLGVYAPGIRHKTALIRTYTALLSAAQDLYNDYGLDADAWMTLVGYFNSLRELGGMRRAVEDAVSMRLRRMHRRGLARRFLDPRDIEELTSRLSASQIPEILDRLETTFDPARSTSKSGRQRKPIDVLLATNMISVGVDVPRLGLMVVAGQPKSTAEYIQATSRVGRRHPGLVVTVYNWTRPRDISHYERFIHYHDTFYQHVEALSVTPFAPRALDRGLTAVYVALVRDLGLDLNNELGAGRFRKTHPLAQQAKERILARAGMLTPSHADLKLVEDALEARMDAWESRRRNLVGARLSYRQRDGATVPLLNPPEQGDWELFTCLNSLRDVEPTANLILDDHAMTQGEHSAWLPFTSPSHQEEASS